MNSSGMEEKASIRCDRCQTEFGPDLLNRPELAPCPGCSSLVQIMVFPVLLRGNASVNSDAPVDLGEAGCFFHPEKKASVVCDGCGRFLCSLCDMEFDGKRLCPSCLFSSTTKGKIQSLEVQRTRHDRIALTMALAPLIPLLTIFGVVSAPVTLYYTIRHWNSPGGLVSRNPRIGLSIAMAIAILELIVFGAMIILIIIRPR